MAVNGWIGLNGCKSLSIAVNGQKWIEMAVMTGIAGMAVKGCKWLSMAGIGEMAGIT